MEWELWEKELKRPRLACAERVHSVQVRFTINRSVCVCVCDTSVGAITMKYNRDMIIKKGGGGFKSRTITLITQSEQQ